MNLTFAPAEMADIEPLFTLSTALIEQYEDLNSINNDEVIAWVRRKIQKKIGEYICIFCDGEKAGYYRFCPAEGMMELDDLYILPRFQNRGIGTAVIKRCCAETDLPVMLYVFTRNTGACALYRRLGFRVTETVGETRCIMVRESR